MADCPRLLTTGSFCCRILNDEAFFVTFEKLLRRFDPTTAKSLFSRSSFCV